MKKRRKKKRHARVARELRRAEAGAEELDRKLRRIFTLTPEQKSQALDERS
jgi:hypothetical protein